MQHRTVVLGLSIALGVMGCSGEPDATEDTSTQDEEVIGGNLLKNPGFE